MSENKNNNGTNDAMPNEESEAKKVGFKFHALPHGFWSASKKHKLSPIARSIWNYLFCRRNSYIKAFVDDKVCICETFALTIRDIANDTGYTERGVSDSLRELKRCVLIAKMRRVYDVYQNPKYIFLLQLPNMSRLEPAKKVVSEVTKKS